MEALAASLDPTHAPAIRKSELALKAQLAWLEGREDDAIEGWNQALAHEAALDYYGQGSEIRVRLARALAARGAIREAAAIVGPAIERARTEGAPGGALLATEALNDLTHVPWRGALAPADLGELRRWCRLLGCPVAPVPADAPLSTRELEVLQRIAAGESNKVIARALDLSLHTVKRHVANILAKLGVETRGQAAAKWGQVSF
jgi:LuxR family maltose regulon positive regulatory protein